MITQPPYADELYSIWPPVIAIAIGAWIVSYGFMSVFNMAVDAIFLCYVLDLERSAHGAPAQHCDASLQELLEPHPAVEHSHGEVREVEPRSFIDSAFKHDLDLTRRPVLDVVRNHKITWS
jgi:hypothetical protein